MTEEIYPGYDPEIDPLPITCWGYALSPLLRVAR
jgi:hypothetical protein